MARKTTVVLTDDLDGTEASETVRFGYNGVNYEIDLNDDNAAEMKKWLENYAAHARRMGSRTAPKSNSYISKVDPKLVREWAATQGIPVNTRGRIPTDIQERYIIFVGG